MTEFGLKVMNKLNKWCEWLQSTPKCSIILIYLAVLIDNLLLTTVGNILNKYSLKTICTLWES